MNKRIMGIVYVLALLVALVVSLFSLPAYLVWALRAAVVVAAVAGVYLLRRHKEDYRYEVAEDRKTK